MGPDTDPQAVVDPLLNVKGVRNLRVIDASIMPTIPSAHTSVPAVMIGEKVSYVMNEKRALAITWCVIWTYFVREKSSNI
uniref:Glucose-methanol-choline oxidoreductase C-terminal domain-containing protein n=1 Tax=Strigamia maritima TaxID=126957 RepID=T1IV62_STRMM